MFEPRCMCVMLLTVLLASTAALALDIKLAVEEPSGAARRGEVVSGGIPLPQGACKDASAFSLFDGETELPVQVSPIVKYPDGSLHWALVSFPVSMPANAKRRFRLRDVRGKAIAANPVVVKEKGDIVDVSNGLVGFRLNKARFNGFESLSFRGKSIFTAAKAGLIANGKGGPGKLTHFEYRYRGPLRTTLYLKGTYGGQKAPTWAMAVTLNAGESAIHMDHNLRNGALGASRVTVTDAKFCLGGVGDLREAARGTAPSTGRRRKGQPAYGWVRFAGAADVLVFLRHGGPLGGKGVALTYDAVLKDNELSIAMNAAKGVPYVLSYGAHKITEIDLVFGGAADPKALAEPLHALGPSAWYAEHDGLGVGRGFGSLADETATYERFGWKGAGDPKKMPKERPAPGLYKSRFDAHGTSESDQMRGLTVAYVRTGQRGFLDRAHAWARYWQTYFLYRSDDWIYGKDGRYRTPKWGSGRCCSSGCHFYASGLFNYALLTGDVDALEAAFDAAEFANANWFGQYSKRKPGTSYSTWGTRPFARCYLVVVRAYDVARNETWKNALLHFANMALKTPDRDPRGFVKGRSLSSAGAARQRTKRSPEPPKLLAKEGVEIVGKKCRHPKYGEYLPKGSGSWPMAMLSWANHHTWEVFADSDDPVARLAAEDARDFAIAQARLGVNYMFDRRQKACYYYMIIDYPIPDYVANWKGGKWKEYQAKGTDSWYMKWWPRTLALGYQLTGDPKFRETMRDVLWWGMARKYVHPPQVAEGEAPRYAWVSSNTKGDWMTPTALAFGVGARQRRDARPPRRITDLKAKSLDGAKVQLTWTTPEDDGGGAVAVCQVKWGRKPLCDYLEPGEKFRAHFKNDELDVVYWNVARNVLGEPKPKASGQTETMTVKAEPGACYFGIRSFDDSQNRSELSNVVKINVE